MNQKIKSHKHHYLHHHNITLYYYINLLQRKNITATLPRTVLGETSPQPTVEQVTIRNQMASRQSKLPGAARFRAENSSHGSPEFSYRNCDNTDLKQSLSTTSNTNGVPCCLANSNLFQVYMLLFFRHFCHQMNTQLDNDMYLARLKAEMPLLSMTLK